jgi:hypothetical protein
MESQDAYSSAVADVISQRDAAIQRVVEEVDAQRAALQAQVALELDGQRRAAQQALAAQLAAQAPYNPEPTTATTIPSPPLATPGADPTQPTAATAMPRPSPEREREEAKKLRECEAKTGREQAECIAEVTHEFDD